MQAMRSAWQSSGMPSRASPLPQWFCEHTNCVKQHKTCGSWPAMQATRSAWQSSGMPSRAGSLPQGFCEHRLCETTQNLWELACLRCKRRGLPGKPRGCHRGQARSHNGSVNNDCVKQHKTCGSWLACDASDAVCLAILGDAIAGKPAPTKAVRWGEDIRVPFRSFPKVLATRAKPAFQLDENAGYVRNGTVTAPTKITQSPPYSAHFSWPDKAPCPPPKSARGSYCPAAGSWSTGQY